MKNTPNGANRYLWFREDSAVIWFRMAVPKQYHDSAGRKLIQESLGTTDLAEARMLRDQRRAELLEGWGAIEPRRSMGVADLEAIALRYGYDNVLEYEAARRKRTAGRGRESWQREQRRAEINLSEAKFMAGDGELSIASDFVEIAAEELGLELEAGDRKRLAELINLARLEAMSVAARRAEGEVEAESAAPLITRAKAHDSARATTGETIIELYDDWTDEQLAKKEKRPDTVRQDRKVMKLFAEFVGENRAISSITPAEIFDFREARRAVPPKWQSKRELGGMSLRRAAQEARRLDLPHTSFVTVNRELSAISGLCKWLAQRPKWAGMVNPCAGLFFQKVKGKNRRPSFDTTALNRIISSPLFTGFERDGREYRRGTCQADDWRKWIPLLCMFTGARVAEIAQLHIGDLRHEHGIPVVRIAHNEKSGQRTKSDETRFAVIHSKLVEIGLFEFVERRDAESGGDADAALFPELQANERDNIGAEPSEWWRDYLTSIGVKDGADGYGTHSFRHTLADRLRVEGNLLDTEIALTLGHSVKSTTGGYGGVPQGTAQRLQSNIEAVKFDGVDFSKLTK